MALKFKLDKKGYEALSDEMKAEYIAGDADGEYVLDVAGLPEPEDTGPLKRALETEKAKFKTLKAERDDLKAKVDAAPDVEAINTKHEGEKKKLSDFANKTLKDSVATTLATKISTVPTLLADKIAARLQVDLTGDEPKTVILDKDGKPSDLTIEKLGEEFVANPEFKSIMIASKASGSGAPGKTSIKPLGAGGPKEGEQDFDAARAAPKDLAARIAERREARQAQQ